VINPKGDCESVGSVLGKRSEGEEGSGAARRGLRSLVRVDVGPEGLADKVVSERIPRGVKEGPLRGEKSRGLAAKTARKKFARRALLHAMRREPAVGPGLKETRDNKRFARAEGEERALSKVDESIRRERDVGKSVSNPLGINTGQVARIYFRRYGASEERLDFKARNFVHRSGKGRTVKHDRWADKGSDAFIRVDSPRGVEKVEAERRSVKERGPNHIVRKRSKRSVVESVGS
jgi:hypothetical protein